MKKNGNTDKSTDASANVSASNASLELARRLSEIVNDAWATGEMIGKVTPVTASLLKYWFGDEFCATRSKNFHPGQRQAILNIVYLHEIMKEKEVIDAYQAITPDLMPQIDLSQLAKPKYRIPKYAVKMATGTGKTWVMHALLLWQILNARHEDAASGRFTQRFLIVAPGLIVYDRLLDAFCGRKGRDEDFRNPETNDFYLNRDLFIPERYREEVFSFIQNNVVTKEDGIGKKTTGDGLIALTNWHLFENQLNDEDSGATGTTGTIEANKVVSELLPVRPGKAAGNDLSTLDRRALGGSELEYLASLPDLMVINDEAHHIHELKRNGETEEVEWQRGLNAISKDKGTIFVQVDFSATPFDTRGQGEKQVKIYFPHIAVDFDLPTAMRLGLVKTLLLDKRQELTELEGLDYNAERDEKGKVIGLSDGQRIMLRAGLTKLARLEADFLKLDKSKNPKMLVVCEDTNVSPFVHDFLLTEGLQEEDIVTIDSNQKGDMGEDEWKRVKAKLFDIDHHARPKVVISVLMLREGFDVNNICVLVPLRSSKAPILLEQLIGRGLRLMWREEEYREIKTEDRRRVMELHQPPLTLIDTLTVVEHPEFMRFYEELLKDGLAVTDSGEGGSAGTTGDVITVGLKPDFEQYDFEWPIILHEAEEEIEDTAIKLTDLAPFTDFGLDFLRKALAVDGETFVSHDSLSQTQFGKYKVNANLFSAASYNEYLQKLLKIVTQRFDNARSNNGLPTLQIDEAQTVGTIDVYIRTRLFSTSFNPFNGNDWKILLTKDGIVTKHIVSEIARAIYLAQQRIKTTEAVVEKVKFSSVEEIRMREKFSLILQKTIYERLGYPSHGGGLEKAFMEFLDRDGEVERFLKISETSHDFAVIYYIRRDGLMATYHPDFLAATAEKVYLIETKGKDKVEDQNVKQKQKAAIEWTEKINQLPPADRMGREWEYVLVGEETFYRLSSAGAMLTDICGQCRVSASAVKGVLF